MSTLFARQILGKQDSENISNCFSREMFLPRYIESIATAVLVSSRQILIPFAVYSASYWAACGGGVDNK